MIPLLIYKKNQWNMILIHIICEKIGVCTLKQLVAVNTVP